MQMLKASMNGPSCGVCPIRAPRPSVKGVIPEARRQGPSKDTWCGSGSSRSATRRAESLARAFSYDGSSPVAAAASVGGSNARVAATVSVPTPQGRQFAQQLQDLKAQVIAAVASLDRGLAASAREARHVDHLASQLELLGGGVDLDWRSRTPPTATAPSSSDPAALSNSGSSSSGGGRSGMDDLVGTWRLIYTSGFNSGSLGGRRPGPPAGLVPSTLGQVYQRIDGTTFKLDNIVELLLGGGLPDLPAALLGQARPRQDTPAVRLTLGHDYEVQGANTVQIVFEDTSAELIGSSWFQNLPRLGLPQLPEPLRPPRFLRAAKFDVTFLDASMRVTRGDRDELRIYLKDDAALEPSQGRGTRTGAAGWIEDSE